MFDWPQLKYIVTVPRFIIEAYVFYDGEVCAYRFLSIEERREVGMMGVTDKYIATHDSNLIENIRNDALLKSIVDALMIFHRTQIHGVSLVDFFRRVFQFDEYKTSNF